MKPNVVTRFAPSPTGHLHIGGARTALFNYLFAKKHDGAYLLRIEDTDKERSEQKYENALLAAFDWLNITSDGPPVRQSQRLPEHQAALEKLIADGHAYEAEESEAGSGKVIRFKNPHIRITFTDLIRGEVTFDTTDIKDFVIARNRNEPLYHLAVVVDDGAMGITHVIRAEEHISNTPRQILILEALGLERPTYAHVPLILGQDRSKLSKRHGAASVVEYKNAGYLPEAVINYLALLGWHPEGEQEIFTLEELVKQFDITRVQKGGAIFDFEKLDWINKEHLNRLPDDVFKEGIKAFLPSSYHTDMLTKLVPILRERVSKYSDINEDEVSYFFRAPTYNAIDLLWKDDSKDLAIKHLEHTLECLRALNIGAFLEPQIKDALWDYATKEGRGSVLWPLRYALSGRDKSPDPFVLAEILGKDEVISRITHALAILKE